MVYIKPGKVAFKDKKKKKRIIKNVKMSNTFWQEAWKVQNAGCTCSGSFFIFVLFLVGEF